QSTQQTLERGSEGPEVEQLQRTLVELQFKPGEIDGVFGVLTESALKMFQTSKKIAPDGIVGPQTWEKLEGGDDGGDVEQPAGVVPGDLLDRCPWFQDDVAALTQRGPRIGVAGPDIVRNADGELVVLEDNVRTPTLMAFAVAARELVAPALTAAGAGAPRPFE